MYKLIKSGDQTFYEKVKKFTRRVTGEEMDLIEGAIRKHGKDYIQIG